MTLISGFNSYAAQLALQEQLQTQRRAQPEEQGNNTQKTQTNNSTQKREALFRAILEDNNTQQSNASFTDASANQDNNRQSLPSQGRGSIIDISA